MIIQFFPPHPKLQGIISNLMIYNAELDQNQPKAVSIHPPIPEHCLYFYPRTPCMSYNVHTGVSRRNSSGLVVGPMVERVNLSIGHDHIVIRVGFLPGGLHRFLGLPAHELFNLPQDSEDFFGLKMKEVNEQLALAGNYVQMKEIVETFLLNKVRSVKEREKFDNLISLLMRQEGTMRVEEMANKACLSFRQLERKCKQRLGMPPKLFLKLVRFSKAYRMFESHPELKWTDIALQCGYFDQAHLVRDFRQFTSVSPRTIEAELARSPLRLQVPYCF